MSLSKEQQDKLNGPLPAEWVKSREGGGKQMLSYVEGWRVIDELNRILGPGSWSYDCEAKEERREEKANAKGDLRWNVTHTAKCRLMVGNACIGDYGAGHGVDRDLGAAIESSIKEACTDALKRCAKSLGMRLGLALYDKAQEHVAAEVPGPSEEGQKLIDEARAAVNGGRREVVAKARDAWARLNGFDKDTLNAMFNGWKQEGAQKR